MSVRAIIAAALVGITGASDGRAACTQALLLAIDVSSSVDTREDALQRHGLSAALMSPEVQQAILLGAPRDWIEIAVYEWSGRHQQSTVLGWTRLATSDDIADAAQVILRSTRSHSDFPTALGYSLGHGATLLQRRAECEFLTLDVSGDGENNDGFTPAAAYEAFPFERITVNGLAIESGDSDIAGYYRREVIRGAGAFVEVADGYDDFERAMRRKLQREIGARVVGALGE